MIISNWSDHSKYIMVGVCLMSLLSRRMQDAQSHAQTITVHAPNHEQPQLTFHKLHTPHQAPHPASVPKAATHPLSVLICRFCREGGVVSVMSSSASEVV